MTVLANRVRETTSTIGTGTLTLTGAFSYAFCTFDEAGVSTGNSVAYCIEEGNDFEIGTGVYTHATRQLTRVTVRLSKIAGVAGTSKMNLAGEATVRIVAVKEDLFYDGATVAAGAQVNVTGGGYLALGTTSPDLGAPAHILDFGTSIFPEFVLQVARNDDQGGPSLTFFTDSASPAGSDFLGGIGMWGRDSVGNPQQYSFWQTYLGDPTSGAEAGTVQFGVYTGGVALSALSLGTTDIEGDFAHIFDVGSSGGAAVDIVGSASGAFGPGLVIYQNSSSPATNDNTGYIDFVANNSLGAAWFPASIHALINDKTSGSEDGYLECLITSGGALLTALTLGGAATDTVLTDGTVSFGTQLFGGPGQPYFYWGASAPSADTYFQWDSAGALGPTISLYHPSASPAASDEIGAIYTQFFNSAVTPTISSKIQTRVTDVTAGTEDSEVFFGIKIAGVDVDAMTLGTTDPIGLGLFSHVFDVASTDYGSATIKGSSAGPGGPILFLYHASASPAVNDQIAEVLAYGKDSAANSQRYGGIIWTIIDPTSTSEDSSLIFEIVSAGAALNALTLDPTGFPGFDVGTAVTGGLTIFGSDPSASTGPTLYLDRGSASPAANDTIGSIQFGGRDSGANYTGYANIYSSLVDPTDGSEDAQLAFSLLSAGGGLIALTLGGTHNGVLSNISNCGATDYAAFVHETSTASANGPGFILFWDSASPAASDVFYAFITRGRDSGANLTDYAQMIVSIADPTNGSEDSLVGFHLLTGGSDLIALTLGTTGDFGGFAHIFNFGSNDAPTLEIKNSSAGTGGPRIIYFQDSASPAASDVVADMLFFGRDSAANGQQYGSITTVIDDPTSGSEDSEMRLAIVSSGTVINGLTLSSTMADGSAGHIFDMGSAHFGGLQIQNSDSSTGGPEFLVYHNSASPASGDTIATLQFMAKNASAAIKEYGEINCKIRDTTAGSEDAEFNFNIISAGTLLNILNLDANSQIYNFLGNGTDTPIIQIEGDTAGVAAGHLDFYANSASPAAGDWLGQSNFIGKDSGANGTTYGFTACRIADPTNGSEDATYQFDLLSAGSDITVLTLGGSNVWGRFAHIFDVGSTRFGGLQIQNSDPTDGGPQIVIYQNSASPAANDWIGTIDFYGKDSGAAGQEYGYWGLRISDATAGSEDAFYQFDVVVAGTDTVVTSIGNGVIIGSSTTFPGVGNLRVTNIELGNDTDTTLARTAAGRLTVEGVELLRPAAQSDQETHTSNILGVTPGTQQYHASACKCWGNTTGGGSPVLAATDGTGQYNMTSITDTATGRLTVTIGNDFSTATYTVVFGGVTTNSTTAVKIIQVNTKAAGSFEIDSYSAVTPTLSDIVVGFDWACFGDLP